jgi:CheY-like chemotaxis protein/HPt (histidine-containing phosphotransfer) domain-containing protein
MGGTIGVNSVEGKGSQFWFTVCLEKRSAMREQKKESNPAKNGKANKSTRTVRILVAEDNLANQQVALGLLKAMGLQADAVSNGKEVLVALENKPYDLLLLDCQMPGIDGYEVARIIRDPQSNISNHDIPIIAMTAYAMKGDRDKCLSVGMNDYLSKPVIPEVLAAIVQNWLPGNEKSNQKVTQVRNRKTIPESGHGEPATWDKMGMITRLMDNEKLARTVISVFLKETPVQLKTIRGLANTGDLHGVVMLAHTIKGSCSIVGAERLRNIMYEIETNARNGDAGAVSSRIDLLGKEFELLQETFKKFRHPE